MKTLFFTFIITLSTCALCKPCPPPSHHPHSPKPSHHPPHPHHGHDRNWWIGPTIFGSTILGSAILNASSTPNTVVVKQPTVVITPQNAQLPIIVQNPNPPKQIWIEGHYEQQIQLNGVIVNIWVPGHFTVVQ